MMVNEERRVVEERLGQNGAVSCYSFWKVSLDKCSRDVCQRQQAESRKSPVIQSHLGLEATGRLGFTVRL